MGRNFVIERGVGVWRACWKGRKTLTQNAHGEPAGEIEHDYPRTPGVGEIGLLRRRIEAHVVQQAFRPRHVAHEVHVFDQIRREIDLDELRAVGEDHGCAKGRRTDVDKPEGSVWADALGIGAHQVGGGIFPGGVGVPFGIGEGNCRVVTLPFDYLRALGAIDASVQEEETSIWGGADAVDGVLEGLVDVKLWL